MTAEKTSPKKEQKKPVPAVLKTAVQKKKRENALSPTSSPPPAARTIAVVRLRGDVPATQEVLDTLRILGLRRVNTCTLLQDTPSITGMLHMAQFFVTWGPVDEQTAKTLREKKRNKKEAGIFRLSPPTLRSKLMPFPAGDLGFRGEKINEFLQGMI